MPSFDIDEYEIDGLKYTPVLVEFTLETPLSKTKSKQIVFTLLDVLSINDEFEVNSINYLSVDGDGQSQTNLIQKIVVQFKFQNGRDSLFYYFAIFLLYIQTNHRFYFFTKWQISFSTI
jgi:hypothetical protein